VFWVISWFTFSTARPTPLRSAKGWPTSHLLFFLKCTVIRATALAYDASLTQQPRSDGESEMIKINLTFTISCCRMHDKVKQIFNRVRKTNKTGKEEKQTQTERMFFLRRQSGNANTGIKCFISILIFSSIFPTHQGLSSIWGIKQNCSASSWQDDAIGSDEFSGTGNMAALSSLLLPLSASNYHTGTEIIPARRLFALLSCRSFEVKLNQRPSG